MNQRGKNPLVREKKLDAISYRNRFLICLAVSLLIFAITYFMTFNPYFLAFGCFLLLYAAVCLYLWLHYGDIKENPLRSGKKKPDGKNRKL